MAAGTLWLQGRMWGGNSDTFAPESYLDRCILLPAGRVEWIRRPVWSDAVAAAVKEVNRRLAARVSTDPGIRFIDLTGEVLFLLSSPHFPE
jgi:hypothetical protein